MKAFQFVLMAVVVLLVMAVPAMAADIPNSSVFSGSSIGAGLGAALSIIGAGYGFGRIGSAALESMARQPEVAARIFPAMIVIAALLEGATLFAVFVCYSIAGNKTF
jgi:F-type H+-transporting ATPase subunit c